MLNDEQLVEKLEKSNASVQLKVFSLVCELEKTIETEPCTTSHGKSNWTPLDYQGACHQLGYDPFKLNFIKKGELSEDLLQGYSEDFKRNTQELGTMCTNVKDGAITVILDNVPAQEEKPLLAHEIFHAAFFATINALGSNSVVSQKFSGLPAPTQLLMEYNHLTIYCTDHVVKALIEGNGDLLGITEILSTIAEIKERTGSFPKVSKNWMKVYQAVHDSAILLGVLRDPS